MRAVLLAMIIAITPAGVSTAAEPLRSADGPAVLTVTGDIAVTNEEGKAVFDTSMWAELPRARVETSTTWTDGVVVFEGVLLRDVIERVGGAGSTIVAKAINDYSAELPTADASRYRVLLADTQDGKPLTVRTKGPLWIVYPRDQHSELASEAHNSKWVWQLTEIDLR